MPRKLLKIFFVFVALFAGLIVFAIVQGSYKQHNAKAFCERYAVHSPIHPPTVMQEALEAGVDPRFSFIGKYPFRIFPEHANAHQPITSVSLAWSNILLERWICDIEIDDDKVTEAKIIFLD